MHDKRRENFQSHDGIYRMDDRMLLLLLRKKKKKKECKRCKRVFEYSNIPLHTLSRHELFPLVCMVVLQLLLRQISKDRYPIFSTRRIERLNSSPVYETQHSRFHLKRLNLLAFYPRVEYREREKSRRKIKLKK